MVINDTAPLSTDLLAAEPVSPASPPLVPPPASPAPPPEPVILTDGVGVWEEVVVLLADEELKSIEFDGADS